MALFLPVLLLLLLQRTAAQNGTVCPGYPVDAIGAVTKAAAVPVCFRVVDGAVQSFRPHVDQFTLLKMHTGNSKYLLSTSFCFILKIFIFCSLSSLSDPRIKAECSDWRCCC